jgi:hypothetical protein
MKAKILLSVLSIVLVAGCVGIELPGGVSTAVGAGNGMEITSFTAEPTSVFSDASVRVTMEIENRGGHTVPADDALIYLTGASFTEWTDDGANAIYELITKEMRAEDVVRGVAASTDRWTTSLSAPELDAGQTSSYIFIGRLYSDYQTSSSGNIWVYSETEAEAARAAGRTIYTPSFTYTKGPVGLSISVSPTPVVIYDEDDTITVYIKVSNLASGTIYDPDVSIGVGDVGLTMDDINIVNVDVQSDLSFAAGNDADSCYGEQELVAGRDLTLICEFDVGAVETFQSFPISVDVTYGYYTERTASVTVQGR